MLGRPFRVFYRLVQTDPPSIEDFMSHEALGILPTRPLSGRAHDWWQGVSHHDSRDAAMAKGNASPWLGLYVAELHVPAAAIVRVEQTGRDQRTIRSGRTPRPCCPGWYPCRPSSRYTEAMMGY